MKRFMIDITGQAVIEISDEAFEAVNDEWRGQFYNLRSELEIAEHIAHNLIINNWRLSQLDGWADQPDENAVIVQAPELRCYAYPDD
jgi:hypothetical protein